MPLDREIEAKFRLTNPSVTEGLLTWPNLAYRFPLTPVRQVVDVDTYFDTPDLRLLRSGRTLRIRVHDDTVLVTTKTIDLRTPKGVHARDEVERAAPGQDPNAPRLTLDALPADVADTLAECLEEDDELRPLCRLEQKRTKRDLLRPEADSSTGQSAPGGTNPAATLAELSIDDVTVFQPGLAPGKTRKHAEPPALAWSSVARFHALEAELLGDAEKGELKEVAQRLRELPGLTPDDQNKLQQAILAMAEGDTLSAADAGRLHVAELCRRVWAQQLAEMLVNEAGVRDSDDIEYVHEMRVATRRARAAGRLYAAFFDPDSRRVRRFLRALRTTGRLLGAVRDLDVALDRLDRYGSTLPEEQQAGIGDLADLWREQRTSAHRKLLAWLDSADYGRFVAGMARFVRSPGAGVRRFRPVAGQPPLPHQVRHTIPSMIMARYESIRAFEVLFESGEPIPIETLHALRIECKYLRYHLEFNSAQLGPEGAELIAALKGLQEHLGDLNDAAVSAHMLTMAFKELQARADRLAEYEDDPYWEVVYELQPAGENDDNPDFAVVSATAPPQAPASPWAAGGALYHYLERQGEVAADLRVRLPADLDRFLSLETRRKLALALTHI